MQRTFATLVSTLALVGFASAHGVPSKIVVNGVTYPGASAGQSSAVFGVENGDPIFDLTSTDMTCGRGATAASQSIPVNPGDLLQIFWKNEQGGNWLHTDGPIQNYITACSGGTCVPDSSTPFSKIAEYGKVGTGNNWVQAGLPLGEPINSTIPANLAPGSYVVRQEIDALQNAMTQGQFEAYPTCFRITVGGSGTATPDAGNAVHFPGAESATDPGVLVDIYDNVDAAYTFPGGPVQSNIADPLSNTNDQVTGSVSVPSNSSPAGSSNPAPASSSAAAASSAPVAPVNVAPIPPIAQAPTSSSASSASSSASSAPSSSSAAAAATPSSIVSSSSSSNSTSSSSGSSKQCPTTSRRRKRSNAKRAAIERSPEPVPEPELLEEMQVMKVRRGVGMHRMKRMTSY